MVRAVLVVAATEDAREHRQVGDRRDRGRNGGGDRTDQDVLVADVRNLVGDHAVDLVTVEHLEQPCRHADQGRLLVATRRERVGLRVSAR